ncbi:uroporphyrinogen-III synthase [Teichococcus aestuarii]|uniref:uroporphyrinogen-III synthase n=1 Tax=Teichococcus aestuarii TaxID=568898 RepID=UPI0015E7F1F7|nr:uroporphyrinogen-III synthase [Pseudoroseomonas aestuarii]
MREAPAILVTRPEPGCAETAAAVAALGWRPLAAPALVLAPLPPPALPLTAGGGRPAQATLLPSRASARALAGWPEKDRLMACPVLAVGDGTAEEARRAGFRQVEAAAGDADSLARLAVARLDPRAGPLLLAVGQGYGAALAAALRAAGFAVRRRVVYAARPAAALPEETVAALRAGAVRGALFLSPRSARHTHFLLRRAGLVETVRESVAFALSPRIAAALAGMPWRAIHATPVPELPALLALLGRPPGAWPDAAPPGASPGGLPEPESEGQERE